MIFALALLAAETASLEKYTPAERRHWAFQPRKNVQPPATAKNPIDAFIRERLAKDGFSPAPPADRATLLRRVTFGLHGLPPTPAEIDAFVNDRSPNSYEKVVDRLLDSPRYGEHWGRHWLDVVRFAESDGFEYDTHRTDAWRYRDYVIHSFNIDKPYTDFVREQLAGDEIAPKNETYRIASGFNRLGPLRKNAGNQEVASSRNEVLTEMTNIVGAGFLGVTLGCARCHDHKFDPIRHTDYYRMQGYFAATHDEDVPLTSPEEQAAWKTKFESINKELKSLRGKIGKTTGPEKAEMEKKLKEMEAKLPDPLPGLFSVADKADKISPIHVLARGDYQNKGAAVGMRPLGVLVPEGTPELPLGTPQPRAKLADWLLEPGNPLTARVAVNRVWHYHFGRGIVATPNDFGRMGARPTHPELLDWLANRFVEEGWSFKKLHREILLSETYRQSSATTPAMEKLGAAKDPENKLLWKFNRRRLEAEELRDASLAVAGKLNAKFGGPSVIVPADPELVNFLYNPSQWKVTPDAAEHDRRSVYLLQKRNLRLPFMEVFDAPDLQISCARREQSTHAPQALELLNGDLANRMAEALAARLTAEAKTNAARISLAYRLATGRAPSPKERALAQQYLAQGSLREFSLAVLNLNSFLYVN
ncbi:MAG: DUF1549 and DUF1553 domain-containing protein [Bryobacteraceae bacterium]|nr:DUF1549 and DUF1553 domain-containing protein [Bryobacteraceae bacterium]